MGFAFLSRPLALFLPIFLFQHISVWSVPSLATNQGLPSMVVNNVNVITGDFVYSQTALEIPGTESLSLGHSYVSGSREKGALCYGWNYNHQVKMRIQSVPINEYRCQLGCHFADGFGGSAFFVGPQPAQPGAVTTFQVDLERFGAGVSNAYSDCLSGQTNLKNTVIHFNRDQMKAQARTGSGVVRRYQKKHIGKPLWEADSYELLEEIRPNASRISYDYDPMGQLSRMWTEHNLGQGNLGWIDFDYYGEDIRNRKRFMRATACTGQNVEYEFRLANVEGSKKVFESYLHKVSPSDGPELTFFYNFAFDRYHPPLYRVEKPSGGFIENSFYKQGRNYVGPNRVKVKTDKDPRIGRVCLQQGPAGQDETPVTTHRFYYYVDEQGKSHDGFTRVNDAHDNVTYYHYSNDQRVTAIEHFTRLSTDKQACLYRRERFFYGEKGGPDESNLICRSIEDGQGRVWLCTTYAYDEKGNVLESRSYGTLTGRHSLHPTVSEDGYVYGNQVDCMVQKFRYQDGPLNLLLEEESSDGPRVTYDYVNGSMLSERKVWEGDKIISRTFYEYDNARSLVAVIEDDGEGERSDCLLGVTFRRIHRIQPTKEIPVGLPEVEEEWYWDPQSLSEVLAKRTVRVFNKRGKPDRIEYWDGHGRLHHSETYHYDDRYRLIRLEDSRGPVEAYAYDAMGNVVLQEGPRPGLYREMTYDFMERQVSSTLLDPSGEAWTTRYQYDLLGNKVSEIDVHGNRTDFSYDEFGRLIERLEPQMIDYCGRAIRPSTRYRYDILDHVVESTDSLGETTVSECNGYGKPLRRIHPNGFEECFSYDLAGRLTSRSDSTGVSISFTYDTFGRLIQEKKEVGVGKEVSVSRYQYEGPFLVREEHTGELPIEYEYDCRGQKIRQTQGERESSFEYDTFGRLRAEQKCFGSGVQDLVRYCKAYDDFDRVIEEWVEDGFGVIQEWRFFRFDCEGNRIAEGTRDTDGQETTTYTEFNLFSQPIRVTRPDGSETVTQYDHSQLNELGQRVRCTRVTDALGQSTVMTVDALDRVVMEKTYGPYGQLLCQKKVAYDALGQKRRETFINGDHEVVNEWDYDPGGKVNRVLEGVGKPECRETRYGYDLGGNLTLTVKPDGTELYSEFDPWGRQVSLRSSDGTLDYQYRYDDGGRLTAVHDLVEGSCNRRNYDSQGNLIVELLGNGVEIGYQYDRMGRVSEVHYPDGTGVYYEYRGCQLQSVERQGLKHLYYARNLSGQVRASELPPKLGMAEFEYDNLGRVCAVRSPVFEEEILYDAIGNETVCHQTVGEYTQSKSYEYDGVYRLVSEGGVCERSFGYDSLGNRTDNNGESVTYDCVNSEVGTTYRNGGRSQLRDLHLKYDPLDRLTEVWIPHEWKIAYVYDSFHRCLTRSRYVWDGAWQKEVDQNFIYVGEDEVGSLEGGQIKDLRALGEGLGAEIGASVVMEIDGEVYVPLHDHHGSVKAVLSLSGEVVETIDYNAFGEETESLSLGVHSPWRYSGKRVDPDTGLVFFGRRYYDPQSGRWITPDPSEFADGPNRYAFLANNPLNRVDAYGLAGISISPWGENGIQFYIPILSLGGGSTGGSGGGSVPLSSGGTVREPRSGYGFTPLTRRENRLVTAADLEERAVIRPDVGTRNYTYGEKDPLPGVAITCVNGIWTDRNSVCDFVERVAAAYGDGCRVDVTHNQSFGPLEDVLAVMMRKTDIPTPAPYTLVENWRNQFARGITQVEHHCHSDGAAVTYAALKRLSTEERQMINVYAYAPARLIPAEFGNAVFNVINPRDPIAASLQSANLLRHKLGHLHGYNLIVGQGKGFPGISQHYMSHEIYHQFLLSVASGLNNGGRRL